MTPRGAIAAGLATVGVQWLLHAGLLDGLPVGARLLLALLVLVASPGAAWLVALRVRIPGGRLFSPGWAIAGGVATQGALVLLTRATGQPFTLLASWSAAPTLVLWLVAAARCANVPRDAYPPCDPPLPVVARVLILLAAFLALVHLLQLPVPIGYDTDSPDHIGTLRRMLATGDAFPTNAFFMDAGASGADPRKGLWHPIAALVASLAHADVLDAWRGMAGWLAATFVLSAAGFGFVIGGGATAAAAGWALLLTYGGSLASPYLREAVLATKVADQLVLVTLAAVMHDLEERSASSRLAVLLVGLGAVAAHVFAALEFALVFGAFGVALVVRERGFGPLSRRLLATAGALGAACLPYLAWRASFSYGPRNVIHTERQGMITLWPGTEVVTFEMLWQWMGLAWVAIPFTLPALLRESRRPPVLYLLSTSVAVTLLMFCPPVVALLQPKLGYLMMRFVWVYPLAGILAFALVELVRAVPRRGLLAMVGLLGLALLLARPVRDAMRAFTHPGTIRAAEARHDVLRWADALRWMDRHLPQGTVVLSDPVTSYSIPMLTRHWVTTLEDQHSSPNDSLALTRLLDARDALDPSEPWSRLRAVLHRWGANTIVLNDRMGDAPLLVYWAPSHAWYRGARARLDAHPEAFPRLHDTGDFVVYGIVNAVLDTLHDTEAARPYLRDTSFVASAPADGDARIVQAGIQPSAAGPGDTVRVWVDWSVAGTEPAGSYRVYLRFDAPAPAVVNQAPRWLGKPLLKLVERLRHERFRFRDDHLPVLGRYGVDLWRPGTLIRDSSSTVVPEDAAPGTYEVQAILRREANYPNLRLADYFFEKDHFSGTPIGTVHVLARGAVR